MKDKKDTPNTRHMRQFGKCHCKPWGLLTQSPKHYSFDALIWFDNEQIAEYSAGITLGIRLTKKNEASKLIEMWKIALANRHPGAVSIALEISADLNTNSMIFASVWPREIVGSYLYLSAGPNWFGEIWRIET